MFHTEERFAKFWKLEIPVHLKKFPWIFQKNLQLWIFPQYRNIDPSYDQKTFDPQDRQNRWQSLVSPQGGNGSPEVSNAGVKINQQAYIDRVDLSAGKQLDYKLRDQQNGVYFFLLNGEVEIGEHKLMTRDAFGVWDTSSLQITSVQDSDLLAIEVPMD